MKTKRIELTIVFLLMFLIPVLAQDKIIFLSTKEKQEAIEKISSLLNQYYVFPEVAKQMEEHIATKFKNQSFDKISDPLEFVDLLTKELFTISDDKHLRLFLASSQVRNPEGDELLSRILYKLNSGQRITGISKFEISDGNIGYVKINSLAYNDEVSKKLQSTMNLLSNVNAIIFDLRDNRGGNPQFVTDLFSYFFDKPTHINSIYRRDRNQTTEFWTNDRKNGNKILGVPLFILISNKTFSGAEEFAYDLQVLKRATIIGENSEGGAHITNSFDIYRNLRISIPVGRVINPVTGTNWECVGVKPDYSAKGDSAIFVAIELAEKAGKEYFENKKNLAMIFYNKMSIDFVKAEKLLGENKIAEAESAIQFILNEGLEKNILDEPSINATGYNFINNKKFPIAIMVLRYNASAFPNSANVFDSLGEAYLKDGQADLAIQNYKKSLELNQQNENARKVLEQLQKE